jgi:cysteinyl-tRNA synthetase
MQITLYNTLTRTLEPFVPVNPELVTIYSCGPTVYSRQHLGNLRAAFLVDLYKNVIKYVGWYQVKHVMNITDVGHLTDDGDHGEDKMEKGARQQGITARDVAEKFTTIYVDDLSLLKVDQFDVMPRATDHIAEQIAMIQELEAKGYTYSIEGDGIYMDTSKVNDYGKLIGKKHMEGLEQGARIDDAGKRNATDFALWKFNITGKKRDMEWESPWGIWFPGRHIECSAMSIEYLGDHIDIHTWGMEHIAIHHTNEICQSECSHSHTPWVNYWIHNQWLMMNGKKIAKSDWNVAFMNEVIERWFTGEDMRYFFLQAQYRSFQDFSRDGLEAASKARRKLKKTVDSHICDLWIRYEMQSDLGKKVAGYLADDFDTPKAIAALHEAKGEWSNDETADIAYLDKFIFKLWLFDVEEIKIVPEEIQALAERRRQAKIKKDWALADTLRVELQGAGWIMKDWKETYELEPIH